MLEFYKSQLKITEYEEEIYRGENCLIFKNLLWLGIGKIVQTTSDLPGILMAQVQTPDLLSPTRSDS